MQRYDFAALRRWLRKTVAKCEERSWAGCVNNLRLYFDWEYERYKEVC
jgi:hypothetical protein